MVSTLFAFNADAIARLIEQTGGHPTAQQRWGILHGGEPPAGLTMDNLAEKVMRSYCQQVHAMSALIGKTIPLDSFFNQPAPRRQGAGAGHGNPRLSLQA